MALVKFNKGYYVNTDYIISVQGDETHCHVVIDHMVMHMNIPGNPIMSNVVKIDMPIDDVLALIHRAEHHTH